MQAAVPESMVVTDFNSSFNTRVEDPLDRYASVGIGPGIGSASETKSMLKELLRQYRKPLVIDADALNIIASEKTMLDHVPHGSILTPHPKEFERLFGESANDFKRIETAVQKAKQYKLVIVLKGHHTFIAIPSGKNYFNSTGNAGMATGGSGDVLTGILTGLLAQSYNPEVAAVLGVYLHGLAGDIAAERISMESMIAGDIIHYLKDSFLSIATL
jgi:NAD(P)H-hydrate epimerase